MCVGMRCGAVPCGVMWFGGCKGEIGHESGSEESRGSIVLDHVSLCLVWPKDGGAEMTDVAPPNHSRLLHYRVVLVRDTLLM